MRAVLPVAVAGAALALVLGLVIWRRHGNESSGFCGLVRASAGYDPVEVRHGDIGCKRAEALIAMVERAAGGEARQSGVACNRGAGASPYELACREGSSLIWVLERIPVAPADVVTRGKRLSARLANWEFALEGSRADAREVGGRWRQVSEGRLVCVDAVPREVLRAWRLRPATPAGGCYLSTR